MKAIANDNVGELRAILSKAKKLVFLAHFNPDGDALGSVLGLSHYFDNQYDTQVITPNSFPQFLQWLPGSEQILKHSEQAKVVKKLILEADVLFCMDFNDPERTQNMASAIKKSTAIKVVIDHHPDPVDFADFCLIDSQASSAAEMAYRFLKILDNNLKISKLTAKCFYTGLLTDTGSFKHNVNTRSLQTAAKLLECGIEHEQISTQVYDNFSQERMQLMGHVLKEKTVVMPQHKAAYIFLTIKELDKYKFQAGDTEGFVNMPLSIKGIVFSAIMIEKEGFVKMSFRSKGSFDVNQFAGKYFNGGGHRNAAGGRAYSSLQDCIREFEQKLKAEQQQTALA